MRSKFCKLFLEVTREMIKPNTYIDKKYKIIIQIKFNESSDISKIISIKKITIVSQNILLVQTSEVIISY